MQGYNNRGPGYVGGAQFTPYPAYPSTGFPNYAPVMSPVPAPQNPQAPAPNGLVYVHGIEGANAYQLPSNVTQMILWDDTVDSFYIKGYDNLGKPRVLAHNDFFPHVDEPEEKKELPPAPQVDLSAYMTKEDFKKMIRKLSVGERGRIVINNEHDA